MSRLVAAPPQRWHHLVVTIAYALLAIAFTYPLIAHLTSGLAGNNIDLYLFPWNAWWARASLGRGRSPFFTPDLHYPDGASLVFHTLTLPETGWTALLPERAAPALCSNLLVLAAPFVSALSGYALAVEVTDSLPAAAIAGLIYGFTPNRLDQARGHLDCAFGPFLPLAALCALLLLRGRRPVPRLAAAVCTGLMLVAALLTRFEQALAALYLVAAVLFLYPDRAARPLWRRAAELAAIAAFTLAIGAPYLVAVARQWPAPPPPGGYEAEQVATSIAIEQLVVPAPTSVAWGWMSRDSVDAAASQRPGQLAFLGVVVLLLVVWSALTRHRDREWRFWAFGALAFTLVSFGPWSRTGLPLPFRIVPFFSMVRAPNRFVPAAVLCLALAIAIAWGRGSAAGRGAWLAVAVAVLLSVDQAMAPFPITRPTPSPFYAQLAAQREPFAVVEIPTNALLHDKLYMYYQTLHGHPMQAGHTSRRTDARPSDPFLARLAEHDSAGEPAPPAELAADLQRLAARGFRYLIFHLAFAEPGLRGLDAWERGLLDGVTALRGPPTYRDERVVVFELQRSQNLPGDAEARRHRAE